MALATTVSEPAPLTEDAGLRPSLQLSPRAVWGGVAAITTLALTLRVVFLGTQSLGYEGTFTAAIVEHSGITGMCHAVRGSG
jgi:hypothetical protein